MSKIDFERFRKNKSARESGAKTRPVRGRLPVKRTINLAEIGVQRMDPRAAAAGIILIVIAAVLFSKFLVTDRLYAMFRAEGEAKRLQTELDLQYAKISSYGELEDEYAHYTFSGMTREELSLVDRSKVIHIVEKELGTDNSADSWALAGNVMTVTVTGKDLQEVNQLARRLESYDLVNMCTVTTAVKEEVKTTRGNAAGGNQAVPAEGDRIVRASIIVYLQNEEENADQTAAGPADGTEAGAADSVGQAAGNFAQDLADRAEDFTRDLAGMEEEETGAGAADGSEVSAE